MELERITFRKLKWAADDANKIHGSDFYVVPMGLWRRRRYGICERSATPAPPTLVGTAKECYMFLLGFDLGAHYIKDYDNIQKIINKKRDGILQETTIENTVRKIYERND